MLRAQKLSLKVWVEAARPRTLPASAAPVLIGTAAGASTGGLVIWRFLLALLVAAIVLGRVFKAAESGDSPDRQTRDA